MSKRCPESGAQYKMAGVCKVARIKICIKGHLIKG